MYVAASAWLRELRPDDAVCFKSGGASPLNLVPRVGKAILELYVSPFEVRYKGSNDPVTDADLRAQDIIVEGLLREFPDDGIISEERPVSEEAARKIRQW